MIGTKPLEDVSFDQANVVIKATTACMMVFFIMEVVMYFLYHYKVISPFHFKDVHLYFSFIHGRKSFKLQRRKIILMQMRSLRPFQMTNLPQLSCLKTNWR